MIKAFYMDQIGDHVWSVGEEQQPQQNRRDTDDFPAAFKGFQRERRKNKGKKRQKQIPREPLIDIMAHEYKYRQRRDDIYKANQAEPDLFFIDKA